MNILRLDVQDGRGLISVVVQDEIEAMRLRSFIKEGTEALLEKDEREMEEQL